MISNICQKIKVAQNVLKHILVSKSLKCEENCWFWRLFTLQSQPHRHWEDTSFHSKGLFTWSTAIITSSQNEGVHMRKFCRNHCCTTWMSLKDVATKRKCNVHRRSPNIKCPLTAFIPAVWSLDCPNSSVFLWHLVKVER